MSMTTHTPTPWHVEPTPGTIDTVSIRSNQRETISRQCHPANAALIVRAVNSHAALVEVLTALTEWACEHTSPLDTNSPHELLIAARAALAAAKAEG